MSFMDFARAHGVDIDPAKLYASERIRRCGTTDKPRSTNGAYFWDGGRGWVFNWSTDARVQWFNDPNVQPWTDAEKASWKAKRHAANIRLEDDYRRAAIRATELINSTKPGVHDYLARKGFPEMKGLVDGSGSLVIPMRHLETSVVMGAQLIFWDEPERKWVKKMMPGMKAKGAVFRMGEKTAAETFLVEGYATGLSVFAGLRCIGLRASVLVCFSAGNLEYMAPQVQGRAFVFADNDKSGVGQAAALATGLHYCMSPTEGDDANDLHMRSGIVAMCKLLMNVRGRHG